MTTEVELTNHGRKRIRQRIGTKKTEELAVEAQKYGIDVVEAKGRLKTYMNSLARLSIDRGDPKHVLVYKNNVFIFKGTILITIFPLPGNLRKLATSIAKKKAGEQPVANTKKKQRKVQLSAAASNKETQEYVSEDQEGLSFPLLTPEMAAKLAKQLGKK